MHDAANSELGWFVIFLMFSCTFGLPFWLFVIEWFFEISNEER